MSEKELQEEEREVLLSIYEGDEAFKELSGDTFQYKYGETDGIKSALVEIKWGPTYPNDKPEINMETFYNKHLVSSVKTNIKTFLLDEAEQYLGCAMTYSLFEALKERFSELVEEQPETIIPEVEKLSVNDEEDTHDITEVSKKLPKKEQLTKAQKRRAWDRTEVGKGGERPRGWNWVDIVKHLSQTGGKESDT